jgi:DNA-binding NarL/FixJ family response regulator
VDELRVLVGSALDAAPELAVVGDTGHADVALRLADQLKPDVVLLDLNLPGLAPELLVSAIARAVPRAAIVAWSGSNPQDSLGDEAARIACYLPKTTPMGEIRAHIVAICTEMVHDLRPEM